MLASAGLNVLFGFGTEASILLLIWGANGYFQSLGWTPCVRVVGDWVPVQRRGRAIGVLGMGYQATLGLTYVIATQSVQHLGWRGALYVPAGLLTAAAVFMLVFLRDKPADPLPSAARNSPRRSDASANALLQTVWLTVSNPALWLLGISLAFLNACRYGYVDWGISHLIDVQGGTIGAAGLKYGVLAIGAIPGVYLTGWATDRFFGGRRAPAICTLLVLLAALTLLYGWAVEHTLAGTVVLLVAIGFCIFGPQVLLVGSAPADLARGGNAAAAAGFVDFLGYVGAALGDKVTGHYKMEENGGWEIVIYIWAGWALAAAVAAAMLWNAAPRNEVVPTK